MKIGQRHGDTTPGEEVIRKRYSATTFHRLLPRAMIAHEPRST